VRTCDLTQGLIRSQLKALIAEMFRPDILDPETIVEDEPLTGGALNLDALDLNELAICIEESFGIAIRRGQDVKRAFVSVASMVEFIHARAQRGSSAHRAWRTGMFSSRRSRARSHNRRIPSESGAAGDSSGGAAGRAMALS
jgi:acyl carrier protein